MKPNTHQKFKIQVVRRNSNSVKRKFSADYRYRQRPKERHSTPLEYSDKLRQTIASEKQKTGCLNTIFYKELQSKSFAEKCVNLLSKKKGGNKQFQEGEIKRNNNFNSMLQNIKNGIKQEKRGRQARYDPEPLINNEFQCVRSQIHQIYSNQQKIQLYRMIRNCQSRASNRRDNRKYDRPQKTEPENPHIKPPLVNPFMNLNTVVCFTMALNDPQPKKQPLFDVPVGRTSFSANHKRRVNISKPSSGRPMAFHLKSDENDGQYSKKLKNFFDFLFKVNFSNNIYVNLELNRPEETVSLTRYKVYIGKGNNSLLIKSLIKRRFWWEITDSIDTQGIHFYWSQNIIDRIQAKQQKTQKKPQSPQRTSKRKKQQDDLTDLNRKILSLQKSKKVENYVTRDGFIIPFDQAYSQDIITNHIPRNYSIGSKKNLFKSLFHYFTEVKHKNPFEYIPQTYHITSTEDKQYKKFVKENVNQPEKVWIVKPGQNSNQGKGIKLSTFSDINKLLKKTKHENGQPKTYIIQSYINRPFLYNNRKFDMRHFMLLTSVNGQIKAYWYRDGYVRTSSQIYDIDDLDNQFIHLTNDAVQRRSDDYQKYETANKLSYSEFQRYLDYSYPSKNYSIQRNIMPKLKQMATYIIKANYQIIDHRRHQNNFEIFGLDFMIDRDFKPWLIQVNYNPCLEVNCPVLERIIPIMLQHSFRIGLDPIFPPTSHFPASKRFYLCDNYLKNLKYELIFDQDSLRFPIKNNFDFVDEKQKEEQYQDEGEELNQLLV